MSEVSIKVNIAGRTYPLTVSELEEAGIRKAEQAIDESIQIFQKNYAVKDKQDLLAMAALQMSAKVQVQQAAHAERVVERVVEKVEVPTDISADLLILENQLDQFLR